MLSPRLCPGTFWEAARWFVVAGKKQLEAVSQHEQSDAHQTITEYLFIENKFFSFDCINEKNVIFIKYFTS